MNWRVNVTINKDSLIPYLIYNTPFKYNEHITLYPVTMKDVILFQTVSQSITLRKNSTFREKNIIKMSYLDFLLYCFDNVELENTYKINGLSKYYIYCIQLLQLCCINTEVSVHPETGKILIDGEIISPQVFDDLRRIIIIQNDIDFNIDEFINYDTEQKLLNSQNNHNKRNAKSNIEDYIDSLVIAMNTTEEAVMKMTIRKFWRYIKRFQLHENYTIAKTGECSGFVSYKEPIEHWMASLDVKDRYSSLKTNEDSLKGKINSANN